jgi:DNA-directed RNA polymerase specialized sigma subunit
MTAEERELLLTERCNWKTRCTHVACMIEKHVNYLKRKNPRLDRDDLLQDAWVIALEALESWDPERGTLSKHVWHRVKHRLLDAARRVYRERRIGDREPMELRGSEALRYEEAMEEKIDNGRLLDAARRAGVTREEIVRLVIADWRHSDGTGPLDPIRRKIKSGLIRQGIKPGEMAA